jgi:hypothetical protein
MSIHVVQPCPPRTPVKGRNREWNRIWKPPTPDHCPGCPDPGSRGREAQTHPSTRFDGAHLWAELHRRPYIYSGADNAGGESNSGDASVGDDTAWLLKFTKRVPCGVCRKHWLEIMRAIPPDFANRERYFAWTVTVHNAVNQRLRKPELDLATAKLKWTGG